MNSFKILKFVSGGIVVRSFDNHGDGINALRIFGFGDPHFVSGDWKGNIRIWNIESMSNEYETILGGHVCSITAIEMIGESQRLLSSDLTSNIRLWDLVSKKCLNTINTDQLGIGDMKILNENRFVSCGCYNKTRIWQSESDTSIVRVNTLDEEACVLIPFEDFFITGDHRGMIRVWDAMNGKLIQQKKEGNCRIVDIVSLRYFQRSCFMLANCYGEIYLMDFTNLMKSSIHGFKDSINL